MHDGDKAAKWYFAWLFLLPLLPACSLVPSATPVLQGFPPETPSKVRQQSADLEQLESLESRTPAQQQQILNLRGELHRFEQDIIRAASRQEKMNDWLGAAQTLSAAVKIRPESHALKSAQRQFTARRQLHEQQLRMELAIHQGEQLLKDAEAYRRLQQLQGPGVMNWLEMKNFERKRRASAQSLLEYAQEAVQRAQSKDYKLAQRALIIAQGLFGNDLEQAENRDVKVGLEQNLAEANRQLRPAKAKPTKAPPPKQKVAPIAELKRALETGDLVTARQLLDQVQQQAPRHPELQSLQSRFQSALDTRIEFAIEHGNQLYSRGSIEQALIVWRKAEALAPGHIELRANIARAEKVRENLRALSAPANSEH